MRWRTWVRWLAIAALLAAVLGYVVACGSKGGGGGAGSSDDGGVWDALVWDDGNWG